MFELKFNALSNNNKFYQERLIQRTGKRLLIKKKKNQMWGIDNKYHQNGGAIHIKRVLDSR